jgi:hypothetical protein
MSSTYAVAPDLEPWCSEQPSSSPAIETEQAESAPEIQQPHDGRPEAENPLARLSPGQVEQLGREFDAIREEILADLGEADARYIRNLIKAHRALLIAARATLTGSRRRPLWLLGAGLLSVAKILENMEIGHNVMHGQWDWMNDPDINSRDWDWDTASPAEAWRHSHNYEHHTFTNIRGKDRDLGYEIMRVDPQQPWHPVYLLQPLYNLLLMGFFEWGVAMHDLNFDAIHSGEKPKAQVLAELKAIGGKARRQAVKDYLAFPALSALSALVTSAGAPASGRRPRARQTFKSLDHLLRPLPRADLHLQPKRGRRGDTRRLVRAPAAGLGQYRRLAAVSPDERQPLLPGRAPPLPGHALHPLRPDLPPRARDLRALRPALQHGPPEQAAGQRPQDDPPPGIPRRPPAQAACRGPGVVRAHR